MINGAVDCLTLITIESLRLGTQKKKKEREEKGEKERPLNH